MLIYMFIPASSSLLQLEGLKACAIFLKEHAPVNGPRLTSTRRSQMVEGAVGGRRLDALGPPAQDQPETLFLAQRETRPRAAFRAPFEADAVADRDRQPLTSRPARHYAMVRQLNRGLAPSVVEARIEDRLHVDRAFSDIQKPVQLVCG